MGDADNVELEKINSTGLDKSESEVILDDKTNSAAYRPYQPQQQPYYQDQQQYRQPPPGYYGQQPPQGYYGQYPQGYYGQYPQGYYSNQQPYYGGGYPPPPPQLPPPQDASRGNPYNVRYMGEPDDSFYYRNTEIFANGFDSVKIRNRFVQRVYSILTIQLLLTFGFIAMAIFVDPIRAFFQRASLIIMIISGIVLFGTMIALGCFVNLRRTVPTNFILLGLFTIAETLLLTSVCVFAHTRIVLYAVGTTVLVCLVISLFAIQTSWDVTGCGMCLCIITVVFMIFGIIMMILHFCGYYFKILDIVFSSIGVLIFSFWLMYDTQQIVGGRRVELSPEEYVFGALSLYVDIVQIFMHILHLFMLCHDDE